MLPPGIEVVEGLCEAGGLYGMVSKPKVGKSILSTNLGLAVATGGRWLGRRVAKGRVCLFQLEDSERTLKRRFEKMAAGGPPGEFWIHTAPLRLSEENYSEYVTACQRAVLVIVDPMIQAVVDVKDWNSQAEVRRAYELWRRLARDTDACVVVLIHARKVEGEYGDAIAGSVQALAAVDGILELSRAAQLQKVERRLSFLGRDWAEMDDLVISLDPVALTWTAAGTFDEAKERAQEMIRDEEAQRRAGMVLDALPEGPPGSTYDELIATTGMRRDAIRKVIESLGDRVDGEKAKGRKAGTFWKHSASS